MAAIAPVADNSMLDPRRKKLLERPPGDLQQTLAPTPVAQGPNPVYGNTPDNPVIPPIQPPTGSGPGVDTPAPDTVPVFDPNSMTPEQKAEYLAKKTAESGTIGTGQIIKNVDDRWASNPGETIQERVKYRQTDRQEQRALDQANNSKIVKEWADENGRTLMSDLAGNIYDKATNTLITKAPENVPYETNKGVEEGNTALDKFSSFLTKMRDTGKYMPYQDAVDEWNATTTNVADKIINSDTPQSTALKDMWNNVGKEGVGGDYYSGRETTALDNLGAMGTGQTAKLADDIVAAKQKLQAAQTPQEKAIAENDLAALQGKLTAPDSEWYKNQSALLDSNAKDAQKQLLEGLGAARGIGGGKQSLSMRDLANKTYLEKGAMLSQAQREAATQANSNMLALKGLENDLLKTTATIAQTGNMTELEANKTVTDHVIKAANTQVSQMNLKLNESLANLDAEFKKMQADLTAAGAKGDVAKWQNEYDMKQRQVFASMLESLMPTGKILQGAGDVISTVAGLV